MCSLRKSESQLVVHVALQPDMEEPGQRSLSKYTAGRQAGRPLLAWWSYHLFRELYINPSDSPGLPLAIQRIWFLKLLFIGIFGGKKEKNRVG